jgi:hypothetical protein
LGAEGLEAEGAVDGFRDAVDVGDNDDFFGAFVFEGVASDVGEKGAADAFALMGRGGLDGLKAPGFSGRREKEPHVAEEFVVEEGSPPNC